MNFLSSNWCSLKWSEWASHKKSKTDFSLLPDEPGLYRVRVIGEDSLLYIGQTGRSVRQRQRELIVYLKDPEKMPYNDPHTAAPNLWAWADANGWEFESSGAAFHSDKQKREGMEAYLLWQYRLKAGCSTQCNFGRFHEDYFKSKNKSTGFRGKKLPFGEKNPAGGLSLKPLKEKGIPVDLNWMGLSWEEPVLMQRENLAKLKSTPCLYRIMNSGLDDVLYIGQTKAAKNRLVSHSKKDWGDDVFYSVCYLDSEILPHQLKELENDLIGCYFRIFGRTPVFQIGGQ